MKPLGVRENQRPRGDRHGDFRSQSSRKNLLGLDRLTPFSLPVGKRGRPLACAAMEDTIKVLALKIEFQPEVPDDPTTTGNGTLDLRSYDQFVQEEGHFIDPAPHNNAYFNSQMEALRRYWYFVSDKELELTWDVYPLAGTEAFRLPVRMSYYGSEGPWADSSIGDKLGHFVIDAVTFVDAEAPEIDFSAYQSIILFHAGSDQQNNIDFINDTPNDFYTGFLRLAEPVYVDDGAVAVDESIIIPETVSQDNRVNALNAVMAHEFGHQLGLVDLYNTANFVTQVGDFSLMDNNGMSVGVVLDNSIPPIGGTIPVYPDAWSRAYLSFDIAGEVSYAENESLFAAALHYPSQEIARIPVTNFEYFLLENRQTNADRPPDFSLDGVIIADPLTGVILGPGYALFQGNDTILVADAEYDQLIPGDGMLIWHIDECPAYLDYIGSGQDNFFNNTLQWDKNRRFVSLEEADGVIDFGGNYYTGYGSPLDMFRADNNASFTPFTNPSSHTNLGADSHEFIDDISVSDTVMYADINTDWLMAGWPQMSRPAFMSAPVIGKLASDATLQIVMATDNKVLIWRSNGEKLIPNADSIGILKFDSSIAVYPLAVAAECDTEIVGRPILLDLQGDGDLEVAVSTKLGTIYCFEPVDQIPDGRADLIPGFPVFDAGLSHVSPIAVKFLTLIRDELLAFDESGDVHLFSLFDGAVSDSVISALPSIPISACAYSTAGKNVIDALVLPLGGRPRLYRLIADSGSVAFVLEELGTPFETRKIVAGDIDRDGELPEIVALGYDGIALIDPDGSNDWYLPVDDSLMQVVLGDLNSDGYPEIVAAGNSRIYAFNYTGALLSNFPINLAIRDLTGVIEAEPVLGDVDGDGNPDIVVGLPSGTIQAYNWHGDRISGFPLPSSFAVKRACALDDVNADGRIDLVSVENSGFVKAWNISSPIAAANVPWAVAGGNPGNNGYLAPVFEKPVVMTDEQLPKNSVFCYPNPARNSTAIRYYLNSDSQVKIDIYDFIGELVTSVKASGLAHADNEYVWDCSAVASGVYYCRVEAGNGAGNVWRLFKIAVVR